MNVPLDSAISDNLDIDECWKAWKDLFLTAIDNLHRKSDTNTPPWIDQDIKHMIKKKYTALRQYRQKRTEGRKRKLRQLTQETKDLIKQKRHQYIEKFKIPSQNHLGFSGPTTSISSAIEIPHLLTRTTTQLQQHHTKKQNFSTHSSRLFFFRSHLPKM